MVSVIQMPQNFRDWAASHIEAEKGDRLISIYANPMEENMHIWERWIEEKRVVCNVYSKNNKGVIKEKREYEVDDENAVLIFRRLYDQASQNFNYSDPGWSSDFHVTLEYIFTTGTKRGMTINEGSTNEFILKDALRFAESGDSISFEEAKASFDLRGFASIATHICFAVDSFDQLCSAYYNLRWVKDPEQAK